MKILFTSDWHIDASTAGVERCAELQDYIFSLVAAIERDAYDLVCFLGDAFDPGSLRECRWSKMVVESALLLAKHASYGAIFIPGNHDVIDSAEPFSTLSPLAAMSQVAATRLRVYELPACATFTAAGEPALAVLALPYVSGACVKTPVYLKALDEAFAKAEHARATYKARIIVIGHYTLAGVREGSESEMLRGRDMGFPYEKVTALAPDLIVNGHYHSRQTVKARGLVIEVVGSPAQYKFGEPEGDHGFLSAEF